MATVELKLPHHRYEIRIGPGLLEKVGDLVQQVAPHHGAALISDQNVHRHYGPAVLGSLKQYGYRNLRTVQFLPGEEQKNLESVHHLYDELLNARLERRSPVVALGGGVIGDLAGFAAASYLRGVPFVQCPTSLLAMVDASVGGKVGVNLPQGKNLVGAFYQPSLVVADTRTLSTLPQRELRCGLAECIKHAMIRDSDLFDWIEAHVDQIHGLEEATLLELVSCNVAIKVSVVTEDEKESGVRAHLNFGHSFAHAIEATTKYGVGIHHGEAVSLGMVAATHFAVEAGRCDPMVLKRLRKLLVRVGLPTTTAALAPVDQLMNTMQLDKKVADGQIRLILPDRLGQVSIVSDSRESDVAAAWNAIRS